MQSLKRNRLVVLKLAWGIWRIWPAKSRFSKIYFLMDSFWTKQTMFELKTYREVMFHDTEKWCKIWGYTDLEFGKWHEKFSKFLPEHSKVSQVGLWWDSFIQSRKCMSLELTEELYIITTRNYAKYEE